MPWQCCTPAVRHGTYPFGLRRAAIKSLGSASVLCTRRERSRQPLECGNLLQLYTLRQVNCFVQFHSISVFVARAAVVDCLLTDVARSIRAVMFLCQASLCSKPSSGSNPSQSPEHEEEATAVFRGDLAGWLAVPERLLNQDLKPPSIKPGWPSNSFETHDIFSQVLAKSMSAPFSSNNHRDANR